MWFLIVGLVLIILGGILILIRRNQQARSLSLKSARPSTVAELEQMARAIATEIGGGSWQEYVRVRGRISAASPLLSELKQVPCVHYIMQVVREYEETVVEKDEDGKSTKSTRRGSETISKNRQSIPFTLQDDSGQITVDPEGADLETMQVLDEFRPGDASGGSLSFGKFSFTLGGMGGGRRTLGYRYTEAVVPVDREVMVVGLVTDSQGKLVLQKPLNDRHYIVAFRSYEALTQSADRSAQMMFYGAIASLIGGAISVLIGLVS